MPFLLDAGHHDRGCVLRRTGLSLTLDREHGEHGLADRSGGVLLRDAPGVRHPELADAQLSRGKEVMNDVEDVIAAVLKLAHVGHGPEPVAPPQRREVVLDVRMPEVLAHRGSHCRGPAWTARIAMSSWGRSPRWADSAIATLSTCARTSHGPVSSSTSRIRSSPKRPRCPGASATPSVKNRHVSPGARSIRTAA